MSNFEVHNLLRALRGTCIAKKKKRFDQGIYDETLGFPSQEKPRNMTLKWLPDGMLTTSSEILVLLLMWISTPTSILCEPFELLDFKQDITSIMK